MIAGIPTGIYGGPYLENLVTVMYNAPHLKVLDRRLSASSVCQ